MSLENKPYDHYSIGFAELIDAFPSSDYDAFLNKFSEKEVTLLVGFMKSGNTWLRFLISHYFLLKNDPNFRGNQSVSYDQLNALQNHSIENQLTDDFPTGQPKLIRSHIKFLPNFNRFKILYISRNPLDTLVSKYHYLSKRESPFKTYPADITNQLLDIDNFALFEINNWIHFHREYLKHSDLHVSYEEMKSNPIETLSKIINLFGETADDEILKKSIDVSSFKKVKEMGQTTNQKSGMAKGFQGSFARKGKVGSFAEELKPETIDKIVHLLNQNNIKI